MRAIFLLPLMLPLAANAARAEDDKAKMSVTVRSILSADVNSAGQPIVFPQKDGYVTATMYEIPPGARLPVHKHPFPRMGYVLEGTLRVTNDETSRSETYDPGAFVLESVDEWHEGANAGTVPLKLLVIDLTEKGAPTTILKR